ncbi:MULTISPECIES: NUDIX hydrolase [unclassified Arthrobacter]|uniref:NUDIX hydrolase n=1 Tax=unclassified Arthrobacter TaxID=235627 RepID=UPI001E2C28C2|nr:MULTISPECIES: NUDIX hydrolase [unclassified Arthrobacter]MCC9144849.1 NUDIX hydrolase [Arthrobacter sp. zg-Y919]MDK1276075.1 NUDIX hydrolase [Arthrobacter sp. zg.Y919]WIB02583.1 NUDIX hydrolase [Arthrobacter sp. zg-Y919]
MEAIQAAAAAPQEDAPVKVVAAGALCWRERDGKLQVLIIHRPRYDDWSWPKGKLDEGETTPECAVREVREEVGIRISLGIPLPSTVYPVASGLKMVHYWASRVDSDKPRPDGKEVDGTRWCSPEEAAEALTNPTDKLPLEELVLAHSEQRLRTWPLIIVRHAKAKPRSAWTRAEGERPLVATGLRQAMAVSRLLVAWRPKRVVSSPWVRCVQTVRPYVKGEGAKFKTVDALTEHSAKRKPAKARNTVEGLFDKAKPVAVCTHRPVLPLVFDVLAGHMPAEMAAGLPAKDPYLAPGESIICQVSSADIGRIVSLEKYRAFDD